MPTFQKCLRGGAAPAAQPAGQQQPAAAPANAAPNAAAAAGKAAPPTKPAKAAAAPPRKRVAPRRMSTDLAANFGTISETWRDAASWQSFTAHLASTPGEGLDSDDREMSFLRYALFLELYVELDQAERVQKRPEPELKELVLGIRCDSS